MTTGLSKNSLHIEHFKSSGLIGFSMVDGRRYLFAQVNLKIILFREKIKNKITSCGSLKMEGISLSAWVKENTPTKPISKGHFLKEIINGLNILPPPPRQKPIDGTTDESIIPPCDIQNFATALCSCDKLTKESVIECINDCKVWHLLPPRGNKREIANLYRLSNRAHMEDILYCSYSVMRVGFMLIEEIIEKDGNDKASQKLVRNIIDRLIDTNSLCLEELSPKTRHTSYDVSDVIKEIVIVENSFPVHI